MNALTILSVADHAQWVLDLAEKDAVTLEDWRHINQLAAELNRTLFSIEQDTTLRQDIRDKARGLHFALTETMRRSCHCVEDLGGFYPKHKPNNLEMHES